MPDNESPRDVKLVGNFTNPQPFKQRGQNELIPWLQANHQQVKNIAGADFGHDPAVEFHTVPVLSIGVIGGR